MTNKGICPICGTEFKKKSSSHTYCSFECYKENHRRQNRIRTENRVTVYQFELDMSKPMEEWEWTKK